MAKGSLTSFSCDLATDGFATERSYIVDRDGQQTYEMDGSGNWQHTNVYADGELMATYNPAAVHFYLEDWLGTKRGQASVTTSGTTATTTSELTCWSLPFGDDLICSGPGSDATEHHFTGKEHDTESQNDYFLARYYASNTVGRFLSPDPSQLEYADPNNPQSLNLYSYVRNNPLGNIDPTGTDACAYDYGNGTGAIVNAANGGAVSCSANGFYITTNQQVSAVGFNSNGDLSVYGANGNLYNPDGSSYNVSQSITVNGDDGSSSYIGLQPISAGTQYISTQPTATFSGQGPGPNYSMVDVCAASALLHSGGDTAIDAFGAIPGDGSLLKGAQLGGGVISAGMAAAGNSPANAGLAGAGLGLSLADASGAQITANVFGKSVAMIPFVGNLLSGFSTYRDYKEMVAYYNDCMAGKN